MKVKSVITFKSLKKMRWTLLYLLSCHTVMSHSLQGNFIENFFNEYNTRLFGPQNDCQMKYEILDLRNINRIRQEIVNCNGGNIECNNAYSKFRTADGSCNNLQNPSWGKSDLCLRRLLPFDYADKVSYPRNSCAGRPLPNPRLISNTFHAELQRIPVQQTTHFMEWGQMLAHDLSHNDIFRRRQDSNGPDELISCCDQEPHICERCYSIAVPADDPIFSRLGVTCLNLVRTVPCGLCNSAQRWHWNQNTAYIDLSLVYGSKEQDTRQLRSFNRGMLTVEYNDASGPTPPTVFAEELCTSQNRGENACYRTGDARSNQNPFILTVQTYLLRHHNFICQELMDINPHWSDERVFQEARRINIAITQYITYGRYLPYVIGDMVMEQLGLNIQPGARYTHYDPTLDASILDEFVTFAGRYGHTLVPGRLTEIDPVTEARNEIWLRDYFFTPFGFKYGQFDRLAKGMTEDRMHKYDAFLTDDVRNFMYRRMYMNNKTTGNDLAALSIVRGRDHGIPGYTYYQRHLFNTSINNFNDLKTVLPARSVDVLETLYESVHDVDMYSGGLSEYNINGGIVGRTFAAVIAEQYRRLKFGDRYWFEHGGQAGSFTGAQLVEIKRMTLANILCETTRMKKVQWEPFFPPSSSNPIVNCNQIRRFDFSLFAE